MPRTRYKLTLAYASRTADVGKKRTVNSVVSGPVKQPPLTAACIVSTAD